MILPPDASCAPRVAWARVRGETVLRATFAAVGLTYPPAELHLRAYNLERRLEVWAQAAGEPAPPFVLVATFPVVGLSGTPGPKRREGDLQVPEGFYRVDRFNPRSRFYLSLGLAYPNASDRRLASDPDRPGTDIFLHGGEGSRGCLALGDDAMALLYLAALDTIMFCGRVVTVHLFPCQMDTPVWIDTLAPWHAENPSLYSFWQTLAEGCRAFERFRQLPHVRVGADGGYHFTVEAGPSPGV